MSPRTRETGLALTRRRFIRATAVLSAAAGAGTLAGCVPPTPTARPAASTEPSGLDVLLKTLRDRRSAASFRAGDLPRERLMSLLWAAWGVNRPDSGKRTAPSAMNAQETDLYVLLADGAYLYDAKNNGLVRVSDQDLRVKAGGARFKDAAAHIIFVPDCARLSGSSQAQKQMWSAAHAGFIGQNIYLYCAAEGLAARFYAGIDAASLREPLKLRADQVVLFGQAVGYEAG